jgi:hypothetical protein
VGEGDGRAGTTNWPGPPPVQFSSLTDPTTTAGIPWNACAKAHTPASFATTCAHRRHGPGGAGCGIVGVATGRRRCVRVCVCGGVGGAKGGGLPVQAAGGAVARESALTKLPVLMQVSCMDVRARLCLVAQWTPPRATIFALMRCACKVGS